VNILVIKIHIIVKKCDNCRQRRWQYPYNENKQKDAKQFYDQFHPVIEFVTASNKEKALKERESKLTDGVAFSYYGTSQVGQIIHRCKYENGGDFPEFIIQGMCKAFYSYYKNQTFDIIMYAPPTESGDLVKNLSLEIGRRLNIPVSHSLRKQRETKPQKVFQISLLKKDNLKDAFIVENFENIDGKRILLIDDICDSKATLKEIGKLLSALGVRQVSPLVIAKTVGGDQV